MKRWVPLFALLVIVCASVCAQETAERRGYIGISFGPSFPVGKFAKQTGYPLGSGLTGTESTGTGLQLNLVNVGYLFSKRVGIAATWFGSAYPRGSNYRKNLDPWSTGAIMLGPLVSFVLSERMHLDLRPMFGSAVSTGQRPDPMTGGTESSRGLAFDMGAVLRVHSGGKISLLATADYYSTTLKFKDTGASPTGPPKQSITTISFGIGIAYRLR